MILRVGNSNKEIHMSNNCDRCEIKSNLTRNLVEENDIYKYVIILILVTHLFQVLAVTGSRAFLFGRTQLRRSGDQDSILTE